MARTAIPAPHLHQALTWLRLRERSCCHSEEDKFLASLLRTGPAPQSPPRALLVVTPARPSNSPLLHPSASVRLRRPLQRVLSCVQVCGLPRAEAAPPPLCVVNTATAVLLRTDSRRVVVRHHRL